MKSTLHAAAVASVLAAAIPHVHAACDVQSVAVSSGKVELARPQPKQLAYTWGGVNSLQGYGPKGGATRVTEVGEPGIELKLTKPKCANSNNV
jgi:hypothetical protein